MNRRRAEGGVQGEVVRAVGGPGRDVAATSIVAAGAQTSSAGATGEAVLARFQGADGERVPDGSHLFIAV